MKLFALLALSAFAINVAAAEPAAPAKPAKELVKSNCAKPELLAKGASAEASKAFSKALAAYSDCTQAFVEEQKVIQAAAHDAGVAAIADHNAFTAEVRKVAEAEAAAAAAKNAAKTK